MISFTDERLFAKGTCNVICSDPNNGDIYYQTNKISVGNITPSTSLNEIRAGLGNPIAAMIPSDSGLQVDFEAADFQMWAKAAQLGATLNYGAPVQICQTVTASGAELAIDVAEGVPVAPVGLSAPIAYVQTVGSASLVAVDGAAYPIDPTTGVISDFTAVSAAKYKVTYYTQKTSARIAKISSFIDPKVVRFDAQIAVYSNRGGQSEGTRVGWLYYTIPYLKLQADATITGDQSNNDTTKISGQAIAYDSTIVSETCSDCDSSMLGFFTYVPDDAGDMIQGLVILGGVIDVVTSGTAQVKPLILMQDGSTVVPGSYSTNFTYEVPDGQSVATVSDAGVITAGNSAGDTEVTVTYTEGEEEYTVVANVSVTAA